MIDSALTVTVNVSPMQLSDEALPATFARHLHARGVDPQRGADLARMMIQLGRMLGLDVIAKSVESEPQRAELESLGCPRAQGYLFARPMNPDELVQRLREGSLMTHTVARSA